MIGRSVTYALVVASAALLATCALLPSVGISRDQAVAVAFDHSALTHGVLVSAVEGKWPLGREPRPTWIVTLRGGYLECESINDRRPSEFERCQMVDGQAIIHVDLTTGEFLGGNVGGPIEVLEGR